MKVTQVKVAFRYKKNLGGYQTADYEAEVAATVEDGEDPENVYTKLWTMAKNQVAKETKRPIDG